MQQYMQTNVEQYQTTHTFIHTYIFNREKNLLETNGCKLIENNFSGMLAQLLQNEWLNRDRTPKGCRYADEIKKFALTLHFHSPKAYKYCR